jgi:biopolymer transport protein ExbB
MVAGGLPSALAESWLNDGDIRTIRFRADAREARDTSGATKGSHMGTWKIWREFWRSGPGAVLGGLVLAPLVLPLSARAQDAADAPLIGSATLPRDLTPWGMYLNADPLVKAVLIGLVFASVLTWTIWLAKTIEIVLAKRRLAAALLRIANARSTAEGLERLAGGKGEVAQFLDAAVTELKLSAGSQASDGIKERVASRLERIEARYGRRMLRATGILATIGATAPFVGLFGTVWGIMNSFIGISKAHTTNLAVVAPGIAEALLATAFGLAAAIPAVVIYNVFARSIAGYRAQLGDGAAEVLRLVSRDLERPAAVAAAPARRAPPLTVAE